MFVASRSRPADCVTLGSFSGHVRARPAAVFAALEARYGPSGTVKIRRHYFANGPAFFILVQGVWWYRAEYRVIADESGSNVEHAQLFVATRARKLARLFGKRVAAAAPTEFATVLRQLRLELE